MGSLYKVLYTFASVLCDGLKKIVRLPRVRDVFSSFFYKTVKKHPLLKADFLGRKRGGGGEEENKPSISSLEP